MQLTIEPGQYIIAVSGGVDSVYLLHLLQGRPDVRLTVAHYDHGIRPDSDEDQRLVRRLAQQYNLPYVYARGNLGPAASEATARQARYQFLHGARQAAGATAIITGHHQDDAIETAIHNIIRGTGRRGLASLRSTDIIERPLLDVTKQQIRDQAVQLGLTWHEDTTNSDQTYTRNYIRHIIMPRFTPAHRQDLLHQMTRTMVINQQIDDVLSKILVTLSDGPRLRRKPFIQLPHAVAIEVIASWLRPNLSGQINTKLLERLVHAAKTFPPTAQIHAAENMRLSISGEYLALTHIER